MTDNNYNSRAVYLARRKKYIRKLKIRRFFFFLFTAALTAALTLGGVTLYKLIKGESYDSGYVPGPYAANTSEKVKKATTLEIPKWIDSRLIHTHGSARSGVYLTDIKNIVIHYVGNPGTSAQNNRDYFDKEETSVSSHFVVGLKGEIIQCVPLYEKSAASNERNIDSISIEVCHPDETGKYNEKTYASLVKLAAWLCEEFDLDKDDVIRHYDITGKICPKYYVENPEEWENLKQDIKAAAD